MSYILETERLRLREYTQTDTDFVLRLLNSPGFLEFIGDRNVRTEAQAKDYLLDGPMKSYADYGYGLSLVERKDDRQAIGTCGLLQRPNLDFPDIGFAFLPEFVGCGYAYEIAKGVLDYGFEKFQLPKIYAMCKPDNARSVRLLEKLGLKFVDLYFLPGKEEKSLLYSLQTIHQLK
ncbi:GNAT family N-acetyltransferase [Persicitalea sp.]|uniref:GNAT family N-acetyltransferase n=1 Tax=Persicitalea sp. TaxID=3100273 RepID=UPI003593089B